MDIFLNFTIFQVYLNLGILTVLHLFLLFPGPIHLDLRDAILPVTYAPTVSSILSIISNVTKNIRLEWFGRGNIHDI